MTLRAPDLTSGDLAGGCAYVASHIVNGGVAAYVVYDRDGIRVATYNASRMGEAFAHAHARQMNAS